MYVAGTYRPSNTPLTDSTQFVINTLKHTDDCRTVFAGDLNFNVLSNSKPMRNFVDTFHQYSLINELNLPTYLSPSYGFVT